MRKLLFLLLTAAVLILFSLPVFAGMPQTGDVIAGFRLLSVDEISSIQSSLYTWRHEKTGALLCHVANDDTNRAFTIAFHTPVMDDTGLPHVFEHAVLGGSEKYPDPNLVYSMMYGTYSTHMNAYTSTTYTAYQTASLSEEQLLANMDVYLDGVFHPLLLSDPHVMMRDAYRYQLSDADGELSLQGVVYSEMLGALSHQRIASLHLRRLLWPGSYTGSLSGGMPDVIPQMTWNDLRDFHKRYYTPGNSLTILYGDLDIERFLSVIGEGFFSAFEEEHPSLADPGFRPQEGKITASFTYPAPRDTEPETILICAVPVGCPDAETQALLEMGLGMMTRPDHVLERRMTSELNEATWSLGLTETRAGSAIVFSAEGLSEKDAPLFREIFMDSFADAVENGFAEEDLRMYANAQRYSNAVARESLNGISFSSALASYWDLFDDPRSVLPVYALEEKVDELVTDGRCIAALRDAVGGNDASVLLISTTEPGGSERTLEARAQKLREKKECMTPEEIKSLVAATTEYDEWAGKSQAGSMLPEVTAVTLASLPEEVLSASAASREMDGWTMVFSELADTDYLSAELMLDLSKAPAEDLLPLRIAAMLLGRLETGARSRPTLERDLIRSADGLSFGLRTLENEALDEWHPVFSVRWQTFTDLIPESVALITEILTDTRMEDLPYIRSMLISDALGKRRYYTVSAPHALALLEAGRQTDEPTAWALLSGGIRLIEYEESLAAMGDEELSASLAIVGQALARAITREGAILTVAGSEESVSLLSASFDGWMRGLPESRANSEEILLPANEKENTRILIDTNVNYNLEYLPSEETGIGYTEALSAFTNLVTDKVLMPVLRFQNSAYSVFFEISRDSAFLLTYRDPNLEKTMGEIYPSLGDLVREALGSVTREELDGYISGVYTEKAMPVGPIRRADLAISGLLCGRDYFEESREAMRALKSLTMEDLSAWAILPDRLYESGLKITVTGPGNAGVLPEVFSTVNRDYLK